MKLAHRQWEIGKAAMRIQTTGEQPILVLTLGKGNSEWYRTWRRKYLGQPDDIKGECMEEGVIGSDA